MIVSNPASRTLVSSSFVSSTSSGMIILCVLSSLLKMSRFYYFIIIIIIIIVIIIIKYWNLKHQYHQSLLQKTKYSLSFSRIIWNGHKMIEQLNIWKLFVSYDSMLLTLICSISNSVISNCNYLKLNCFCLDLLFSVIAIIEQSRTLAVSQVSFWQ